jgi:hypothetical protein
MEKNNHCGRKWRKKTTVIVINAMVIIEGFNLGNRKTNNKTDYFTT